ncbi:MAG: CHAT domain-containing protein [Acidobacteria bacterium]|nr:CHAT domain-containing protein [Acidobacteriota bacterium]
MRRAELINKLLAAGRKTQQLSLIRKHAALIDLGFARELKNTYYNSWTTAPRKTLNAARALEALTKILPDEEVGALASWVRGIADLTGGKLEKAVRDLDAAAAVFLRLGREHDAARTQVAKLIALALLGKYDESVKTGRDALRIFEKYGDELAAGKIEKNLGNVVARQGKESAAEKYYLAARRRFVRLDDRSELAMNDNSLANTYAELNDFHRAEKFYAQALESARRAGMHVTEAEIEASMGNLALFRGQFDEALRFLELSRQKYRRLKMPHQTAIAELEIAEIYLELNLLDEAYAIYKKVAPALGRLKLQGEEARARANFGKAALLRKEYRKARRELEKSARLYLREKNPNGAASVKLSEAHLELSGRRAGAALKTVREAEKLLAKSENRRSKLLAKWLRGEILQNLGRHRTAARLLTEAYDEALAQEQSNLAQICLNSLGNLALRRKEPAAAEDYFRRAVEMIENLRAPLPAEEFRMAFLADKLAPFENLTKIYLARGDFERALIFTEKARARTLAESLRGEVARPAAGEASNLGALREELNWFYSRLNRAAENEFAAFQKEIDKLEKRIAAALREIESTRPAAERAAAGRVDLDEPEIIRQLRKNLGPHRALIEFVVFDDRFSAFVVTDEKIEFVADLAAGAEILALLEGLRFQFGALRYGAANLGGLTAVLKKRADFYLEKLAAALFEPLATAAGARDLVIVPAGIAHYVPFHALRTNGKYLIETREIVSAPSAAVRLFLEQKPARRPAEVLLMGFADEKIPLVEREIDALKMLFPAARAFTGADATLANFARSAPGADVLHLACHGQFRPENPLFSSLHLADGFITVRDICGRKLDAGVVTLSACETGLNQIFAGDELLGLARGFLAAGADSLVLSLWTVSDEATARLMKDFYEALRHGAGVPAALRTAQRKFIESGAHPYYWSPFTAIGK